MSGLTASQAHARFVEWIAATPLDAQSHDMDKFVQVLNIDELRNDEHDRRFYCLATEGPEPANGSNCIEALTVELSCRWLHAWASQARMLDDLDILHRRIKAFTASEQHMYRTQIVGPPRQDYVTLATSALASYRVRLEYHK